MCEHHLAGGPLVCTRPAGHQHGHVYESAWLADDHDRNEAS